MRPIKPGLMPHTVTLYNVFKSPVSGHLAYFRTYLRQTRIISSSSAVNVATIGWTRAVTTRLLVDPATTLAYRHGTNNIKIQKKHIESSAWNALPEIDKDKHWTLNEGDYIVQLENNKECLAISVDDMQATNPRKIHSIESVLNKNGTLHHWELHLD